MKDNNGLEDSVEVGGNTAVGMASANEPTTGTFSQPLGYKTLYIVYADYDYEGSEVIGVFDTEEQATYVRDNVKIYGGNLPNNPFVRAVKLNKILGDNGQYTLTTN